MSEMPKRYTPEEDEKIVEAVELAQSEGRALEPVFAELAKELERTQIAINYRYYNVIKKRKSTLTEEQQDLFVPFTGEKPARTDPRIGSQLRHYSTEEDERISLAVQVAEEEGIPLVPVYTKLAEELERSARAIEWRSNLLKKRLLQEDDDSDEEDDGREGIVSKLKSLVKERDYYKSKYETVEEKMKDYDRMAKEYRQIRKLLD